MRVRGPNNVGGAKEELCKRIQHCCATLRRSRNGRNVGSCWFKGLTGFKLCATTPNNMQQGVQTAGTCNIQKNVGSCWPTMLRPFAWDLTLYMTAIAFLTFSLPSPSWFSAWATKYTRQKYWTYSELHDFKYNFLSAVSISFPQEWKH